MNELEAWLTLHRAPGVGNATLRAVLENFGSIKSALENPDQLRNISRINKQTIDYINTFDPKQLESDLNWLAQDKHHLIRFGDANYPTLLAEIPDAPMLLFCIGDPGILSRPQIAVVGSRNPSQSGSDTAYNFARHLAQCGFVITSGLALGIDAAAHKGALAASTPTIAVFGTGVDRVYPSSHRQLAHDIVSKGGCLISEFPLGLSPNRNQFPQRNRIISGLSLGTLVVEAAIRSGSLISARLAAEQGREVFAIPGSIHNPLARGCHSLIRQGAKLVETAEHILEELGPLATFAIQTRNEEQNQEIVSNELDSEYKTVLSCLGFEPTAVDMVVERSGLTAKAVSSMLLVLELQGYVNALPGGMYTRIN